MKFLAKILSKFVKVLLCLTLTALPRSRCCFLTDVLFFSASSWLMNSPDCYKNDASSTTEAWGHSLWYVYLVL